MSRWCRSCAGSSPNVSRRRARRAYCSAPDSAASADAALINGTAAHALDFDDVALGGHPSTVLMPAVLAEGERLDVSGEEALIAYLVGYEVWAELAAHEPDAYHLKGWHPTSVLGTVGAAAAVAYLHKLSRRAVPQRPCARGQHGRRPRGQLRHHDQAAACRARRGLRHRRRAPGGSRIDRRAGCARASRGLPRGSVAQGSRQVATVSQPSLGKELRVLDSGLSIKKYPMCYATHRVIDGMLDLVNAHDVKPADVAKVHATIGIAQASMLRNHSPQTGLEAKFSLEFAVASSLVARKVGLQQLNDEFVRQPEVREAMTKVASSTVDTRCPVEPIFSLTDQVVVELKNGRKLDSGEIRFARGNAMLPLKDEELKAKFLDCCSTARGIDAEKLYGQLINLKGLKKLRQLG